MSSTAASSAPDGANQRDSWIPVFSGQPSDYKEWRKRITLYHQKMVLGKRRGESILNIVGSLTGTAWRLVEDFDVAKAEDESSFAELLKLLDSHFQYDDRVQLPADFDGYFGLSRKPNQTLLSFVSDHDECHRKLEKHNVSLPEAVQGWHLLRKANLTKEQRQLVTLRAPNMKRKKVVEALYLILGQDYKASHGGHGHHKPFTTRPTSTVAMQLRTMRLMRPMNSSMMDTQNGQMMVPIMAMRQRNLVTMNGMKQHPLMPMLPTMRLMRVPPTTNGRTSMCMMRLMLHTSTRASASQTFASPEGTCRSSHLAILQLVTSALASLRRPRALRLRRVAKDLRRGNRKVDLQRGSPTTTSSSQHQ